MYAAKKLEKQQSWLWCSGSSDHLSLHHNKAKLREQPIPAAALQTLNNVGSVGESKSERATENRSWREREACREATPYFGQNLSNKLALESYISLLFLC